jgi:hypothetical protein
MYPCCTKDQAPEANVDGESRTLGDEPSLDKAQRVRLARVTRSWNILRSAGLRTCTAFISLLGPRVLLPRFRALRTGFRFISLLGPPITAALPCASNRVPYDSTSASPRFKDRPTSFLHGRGSHGRCVSTDASNTRCARRSGPFMGLEFEEMRVMGRPMNSHKGRPRS